jgi:hypothetical protein
LFAHQARVLQQYVEERSVTPLALNYDFALITLSAGAPKGTTYLDIAAGDGTTRYDLTTAGYPADKAGQDMWTVRLGSLLRFVAECKGRLRVIAGEGAASESGRSSGARRLASKWQSDLGVVLGRDISIASPRVQVNCSNVAFDFTNGPSVLNCGSQCSNIVVHDCLSYEGQSGSAIWSTVRLSTTFRFCQNVPNPHVQPTWGCCKVGAPAVGRTCIRDMDCGALSLLAVC